MYFNDSDPLYNGLKLLLYYHDDDGLDDNYHDYTVHGYLSSDVDEWWCYTHKNHHHFYLYVGI